MAKINILVIITEGNLGDIYLNDLGLKNKLMSGN